MTIKQYPHQQPFNVKPSFSKRKNGKPKTGSWWFKHRVRKANEQV